MNPRITELERKRKITGRLLATPSLRRNHSHLRTLLQEEEAELKLLQENSLPPVKKSSPSWPRVFVFSFLALAVILIFSASLLYVERNPDSLTSAAPPDHDSLSFFSWMGQFFNGNALTGAAVAGGQRLKVAATAYYDPVGDSSVGWTLVCVSPSCTNNYEAVDDATRSPTAPSTSDNYVKAGSIGTGQVDEWTVNSITESNINTITLYIYAETGSKNTLDVAVQQTGTSQCTISLGTSQSAAWSSCAWSGPSGDLSAVTIEATHTSADQNFPATSTFIYEAYLEIDYSEGGGPGDSCSAVSSSKTLSSNISATAHCLPVTADHVVIDGAGYTITGNGSYFGINGTGRSNITIRNIHLRNFSEGIQFVSSSNIVVFNTTIETVNKEVSKHGIDFFNVDHSNISQNEITTSQSSSYGVYLSQGSDNNTVFSNLITTSNDTTNSDGIGIYLSTANNNSLLSNNITTYAGSSPAIQLDTTAHENKIKNNIIYTSGSQSSGISLSDTAERNLIENNNITTNDSGSYGINIGSPFSPSKDNLLVNNNITAKVAFEIFSKTGNSVSNMLIYNNSFGDVRWVNNGSLGFPRNLTLNITNDQGLGLGRNLVIGNNTFSLNSSAFDPPRINSSANITLTGIPGQGAPTIIKSPGYLTSRSEIINNGSSCLSSGSCTFLSFENGKLSFNTTSFSGFGGNNIPTITSIDLNTTLLASNRTRDNLTAYVVTDDADGDSVKTTYTWYKNGTVVMILNMPFEKLNGTSVNNSRDYSGNQNHAVESKNPVWNATGGYDQKGAYQFNGIDQTLNISFSNSHGSLTQDFSISAWIKPELLGGTQRIVAHPRENSNNGFGFGTTGSNLRFTTFGVKDYDGTTGTLQNGIWYHVVAVLNSSFDVAFYINGVLDEVLTHTASGTANSDDILLIGGTTPSLSPVLSELFNGTIDELMIWNRSISAGEAYNLFSNRTAHFASNETTSGENWTVMAYTNDGIEDGNFSISNQLIVRGNNISSIPALASPAEGNTTTNRTPLFTWNTSIDNDPGDIPVYHFQVDDSIDFSNPEINVSDLTNSSAENLTYQITSELGVDTTYYWRVRSFDGEDFSSFSSSRSFTVQSYLSVTLWTDVVNFSIIVRDQNVSTPDNTTPFRIENSGNIQSNVTITASQFFSSVSFPTEYYRFRVAENETGSFNTTSSQLEWLNMNGTTTPHVWNLDWHNHKNDVLVHLNVLAPHDEGAGWKSSTVTFTIE